jgi:uncharacterized membrane protein
MIVPRQGKDHFLMFRPLLSFANLLLASLVVGSMFGIWLAGNLTDLSPSAYVQLQQHSIRALNVTMPVLGWLTALVTAIAAILARKDRLRLTLLVAALICLVASGIVTRFLNQPINAIVMTWSEDTPPANWMQLRDEWWRWHVLRTALGVIGLSLIIVACPVRGRQTDSE